MKPIPTLLLGAAGRDFHVFNTVYRDDPAYHGVAFTAAQIPGIAARRYPASLAGPLYPDGIPIEDEASLEALWFAPLWRILITMRSPSPCPSYKPLAPSALPPV